MEQYELMLNETKRLFDLFNEHYYGGKINKPVITIQSNGKSNRTMGWCTMNKIWKDHSTNAYYYEINVCSEYLYRDAKEICATLLHEMVHLYCAENNIKDTSRGCTYHNKRFKSIALSHGLNISYNDKIGWSISELNDEANIFVNNNVNSDVFTLTRLIHESPKPLTTSNGDTNDGEDVECGNTNNVVANGTEGNIYNAKNKQYIRRYVCPKCGTIIRATKEVNAICGICNVKFEQNNTI